MIPVRKIIADMPVYTPARSIESVKQSYHFDQIVKLSANENTLGFSDKVYEALQELDSFYPDGSGSVLRTSLAENLGIPPEQIVLGNGSFELISLTAQLFLEPDTEAIMAVPSFGWYKNATLLQGARIITVPLDDFHVNLTAIAEASTDRTKVIWLTNPNNPTGTIFTKDALIRFLQKIPRDIAVVLDEAYAEYVENPDYPDSIRLLADFENLIILRTFSKVYGLAGFRIGYAIASREIISYYNRVRMPMNVSSSAQYAALASLKDPAYKQRVLSNAHREKERYYEALSAWSMPYVPSETNFILVQTGTDSDIVVQQFLEHGLLIRGGKEYGYPDMLRITIGTHEENTQVLHLLEKYKKG